MTQQIKKPTKGDLERRMKSAVVLIPRDKDYKSVYFDDKGLRLEVTQDFCVISTMFHKHVFSAVVAGGVSRPYVYTQRFIDFALENDCEVRDAKDNLTRSYAKLMSVLKEKEDKTEYNVAWYYDLWLNNIFHPLYGIGESESEAFLVYEQYMHNLARNQVVFSAAEKKDGLTNLGFVNKVMELEKTFVDGMQESVLFEKESNEEKQEKEAEAINEHLQEEVLNEQNNNG